MILSKQPMLAQENWQQVLLFSVVVRLAACKHSKYCRCDTRLLYVARQDTTPFPVFVFQNKSNWTSLKNLTYHTIGTLKNGEMDTNLT